MAFIKISQLPAATALAGTDELEANQALVSRKVTLAQVTAHVAANTTLDDLAGVDTSTTPAAAGNVLTYNGTTWVAGGINVAASSVTFTPSGNIAATNVSTALAELDTEKLDVNGTAAAATKLATARNITFSSDATGSASFDGSADVAIAVTLANSGATAGTYGSAAAVPAITVDAKGRITAVSSTPIAVPAGSITFTPSGNIAATNVSTALAELDSEKLDVNGTAAAATKLATARNIALSTDATGSASFDGSANATIAVTLANSGVTAGTYGSAAAVPAITVDAKGRITAASSTAIAVPATSITFTPTGNIAATNVSAALAELDTEKLGVSGVVGTANEVEVSAAGSTVTIGLPNNVAITGTLGVGGNTTLGDAAADTLTVNGTAVSIPNGLNIDAGTLVIDAANNRVGFGQATPAAPVDVTGTAAHSFAVATGGTMNLALAQVFTFQVLAATTFSFSNVPAGRAATVVLHLTNGGSQILTWPAAVKWPAATQPILTASGIDVLVFTTVDGGTNWRGNIFARDAR